MRIRTWAPGSISVVDYVLREPELQLSALSRLVYLALFSRMGGDYTCFPSVAKLAGGMGLSERAVQRHIKLLEQTGFIQRTNTKGGRSSTLYRLFPPWEVTVEITPPQAQQPESHRCSEAGAEVQDGHRTSVVESPEETHTRNPNEEQKNNEEGVTTNDQLAVRETFLWGIIKRAVGLVGRVAVALCNAVRSARLQEPPSR